MATKMVLVGVQHKDGEFLNERARAMQKYNNILLYANEEFDEEEIAYGMKSRPELKVKYDDFEEMTGIDPKSFLENSNEYVGRAMRVYYDDKTRPIEIRFFDAKPKATDEEAPF